ncbi:MAG: hypothetical protein J5803_04470, partial [Desulfovibrio sp.]|nr:hypothetical protein [Desulfovibrio sp.]
MEFIQSFFDLVLHIDVHLAAFTQEYGVLAYAFLFLVVFCETGLVVTPFLPGDSLLFAAGVAAGGGLLSFPLVVFLLLAAGIFGDATNFVIGRFVGPVIFKRETRFIKKQYLLT